MINGILVCHFEGFHDIILMSEEGDSADKMTKAQYKATDTVLAHLHTTIPEEVLDPDVLESMVKSKLSYMRAVLSEVNYVTESPRFFFVKKEHESDCDNCDFRLMCEEMDYQMALLEPVEEFVEELVAELAKASITDDNHEECAYTIVNNLRDFVNHDDEDMEQFFKNINSGKSFIEAINLKDKKQVDNFNAIIKIVGEILAEDYAS